MTKTALEPYVVPLNQAPDFEEPQSLEFVIELPKATEQETLASDESTAGQIEEDSEAAPDDESQETP